MATIIFLAIGSTYVGTTLFKGSFFTTEEHIAVCSHGEAYHTVAAGATGFGEVWPIRLMPSCLANILITSIIIAHSINTGE